MLQEPGARVRVLVAGAGLAAFAGLVWTWGTPAAPEAPAPYRITHTFAAHGSMVVEVEVTRPYDAMTIARDLVEPVQGKAAEVLVYFYGPGRPRFAERRVQWTASGGYGEIVFESARTVPTP
jgi:hypothetical protein